MASFGHIVLEGYCMHDDEPGAVPCDGKNVVSPKCLEGPCEFFDWCKAANMIVMTDDRGQEVRCAIYDDDQRAQAEARFFARRKAEDE